MGVECACLGASGEDERCQRARVVAKKAVKCGQVLHIFLDRANGIC